jgi:hypothetical protein
MGFNPRSPQSLLRSRIADFAQLSKVYTQADVEAQRRSRPPDVTHTEKVPVMGESDPDKICTSHVERQNLTIRM